MVGGPAQLHGPGDGRPGDGQPGDGRRPPGDGQPGDGRPGDGRQGATAQPGPQAVELEFDIEFDIVLDDMDAAFVGQLVGPRTPLRPRRSGLAPRCTRCDGLCDGRPGPRRVAAGPPGTEVLGEWLRFRRQL